MYMKEKDKESDKKILLVYCLTIFAIISFSVPIIIIYKIIIFLL